MYKAKLVITEDNREILSEEMSESSISGIISKLFKFLKSLGPY